MSHKQALPYNAEEVAENNEVVKSLINTPNSRTIVFFGSVVYFTQPGNPGFTSATISTSEKIWSFLDQVYIQARGDAIKRLYIFNGANLSPDGKEGTTFTTSSWVNHPEPRLYDDDLEVKCIALAPYETEHMEAVWMEEQGHSKTTTLIVGKSHVDRRKVLANVATVAYKYVAGEGGPGSLEELYNVFKEDQTAFMSKGVFFNNSYLARTVISKEIEEMRKKIEAYTLMEEHITASLM